MKAVLLALLMSAPPGAAQPPELPVWQAPASVVPQWVGDARPKGKIKRIVTIAPSATETLFALGHEAKVVGVTRFDDRPERVKKLPKIGGFWDPNVESVLALAPDLVIAAANVGARPALQQIAKLGVPVYAIPGDTLADAFHATRAIAALFGPQGTKEGRRVLSKMRQAVQSQARAVKAPKTILVVLSYDPLVVAGPDSLPGAALRVLGHNNAVKKGPRPYPHWSAEVLLMSQPDVIIDAAGAHGHRTPEPWRGLDVIPAVKAGRVHALDLAIMLRPSPRIAEGIAALSEVLNRK